MRTARFIPTVLAGVLVLVAFSAAPTLAAPPEEPVTLPATEVTATTAVLHGELNPHAPGQAGEEWLFQYTRELPAACEGEYLPEPFGTALGHEKEAVEAEAKSLRPNQTYWFCLAAKGETFVRSTTLTFKTLPAAPSIYSGSTKAAAVGPFSATLEALVNPNNEETTYSFDYSSTAPVGEKLEGAITEVKDTSALTGYGEIPASVSTGNALAPETTYYFRVIAENAQSKKEGKLIEGPIEQFTTGTPEKPVVIEESENVTALNTAEPKFEAKINPNYQATEYHFEYANQATEETLEGPITIVEGAPPRADLPGVFEEAGLLVGPIGVKGLKPGPTYYRVVATNGTGTTDGPVQEFRAQGTPAVTTGTAGAPTRTTAVVSGSIVPEAPISEVTSYHFAYVPQAEYEAGATNSYAHGETTSATVLPPKAGFAANAVAATLQELAPGTTYDYALVATNELGTVVGANQTFTTAPPAPPVAITGGAEGVGQLSASIGGTVDPDGYQTTYGFQVGIDTSYGVELYGEAGAGEEPQTVSLSLANLQPGTTYHYRLVASSVMGTSYGADQTFTTAGFATTVLTAPLPAPQIGSPAIAFPSAANDGSTPKVLTNAEKLAKALKACHKKKGSKRLGCEKAAHKKYAPAKKIKKKK